jgi:LacI family transcriptional regulator
LPEQERGATPPRWLRTWKGDGVIARIETAEIANAVSKLDVPVVDVSSSRRVAEIPWVETDDDAIATLAFEHFFERGFRQFAFCGPRGFNWSTWRRERFAEKCRLAGLPYQSFETDSPYTRSVDRQDKQGTLQAWLRELPKPIGILCAYDIQAQVVLDICRNLDIQVPEQVAVIGVDNDPLLCDLCHPSLTSIAPDARGAGFQAAELLEQLMASRKQRNKAPSRVDQAVPILMKPLGVIQRQSTDVTAITDRHVAAAIRFIRDHACDGINVVDVLDHVHLSRRTLESQFVQATGKSPHEMIVSVRMDRVRRLLQQSDLSLDEIAHHAGYEHTEYMSVVFKKRFGVSPGRFRRK